MDFTTKLNTHLRRVELGLEAFTPTADTRPARLHAAMRYSLQAGGKRLRPILVLASAELCDPEGRQDPLPAAVAIECIHTYSLIHDDLPCMDDDELRRGRPTCHRAFDEATALLAGDALLTHAFALLATAYAGQPALAQALVRELGQAAGSQRLIGGQMEDLLAEKRSDATTEQLEFIHRHKTAAMIEASLTFGALLGNASESTQATLRRLGQELGLAFQIVDDILDATADSATLGKTAGKDVQADKTTFVKLHGLAAARQFARHHTTVALTACAELPGDTAFLRALVEHLLTRDR